MSTPIVERKSTRLGRQYEGKASIAALRILVADPNEVFRCGLRSIVSHQQGWKIIGETTTVKDSLRELVSTGPDVVILDLAMTDEAGWEALASACTKAQVRLLILSDHFPPVSIQRALALGARACLFKSEGAQQLMTAIAAVGLGQTYLSPRALEALARSYTRIPGGSGREIKLLTARQVEVLRLLAEGKTNKEVSARLGISQRTVETHRSQLMCRLGLHSITELVRYAIRNGHVTL